MQPPPNLPNSAPSAKCLGASSCELSWPLAYVAPDVRIRADQTNGWLVWARNGLILAYPRARYPATVRALGPRIATTQLHSLST